ncbi:MAG: sigma-70 family RNA polymerase sigma factor [Labilithrix sp.]|nr:sigma-70 family RNA polymerase sigma factor [Labilithrix sp.]MCW5814417.1 sigma-70 family RNA polymerase sigma factor [Labilithrix sp.]
MSLNPSPAIGPDLRAALLAMVKKRVPESEAEDIVQSTLTDAFASPHAPADAESFRRWIFGVAKNKVVDYHRRAIRETFDMPEVAGKPAPHQEADLLRWAEKHLPPGDDNKATLDWMLREGEGEKLESIAETENLPAPRVRQRVSRLRRHLKSHWQKEVALLATLGVLITAVVLYLRSQEPDPNNPIAKDDVARAEEMRHQAFDLCKASQWTSCIEKLDDAKRLDPAGDTTPAVQQARDEANKAITLPPVPTPAPTLSDAPDDPLPLRKGPTKEMKMPSPGPTSSAAPPPGPMPAPAPAPAPARPKGKSSLDSPKPPPAKATSIDSNDPRMTK